MSDFSITFSSSELLALRTATSNERDALQDDLENNRVPKSEISDARKSIELCSSAINKIDAVLPNPDYEPCCHKS